MIVDEDKLFILTCLIFLPFHVCFPTTTLFISVLISGVLFSLKSTSKINIAFLIFVSLSCLLSSFFFSNIFLLFISNSVSLLLLFQQLFPAYNVYKTTEFTLILLLLPFILSPQSVITLSIIGISSFLRYDGNLRKNTRFFLSFTIFGLAGLTFALLLLPLVLFRPWDIRNIRLGASVAHPLSRVLNIQWEIRNKETISNDCSAVIISNHQSILDVLGMLYAISTMEIKCTVVAKKSIFWVWPFGLTPWLCGIVFISRRPFDEKTRQRMNEAAATIEKQKAKIWLFPEGTRNKHPNALLPFKKGAFRLAIKNQIPIIPVVFSPYHFINWREKRFDAGTVILDVLPSIPTKGYTFGDLDVLTDSTYSSMNLKYQELKKEVAPTNTLPTKYLN